MEPNLNYPIKYALLKLKEPGGWDHNYEDIDLCFIPSKCYVINQNIRYYQDGTSKLTYEVVFPYKDIHTFKYRNRFNEEANKPRFSSKICLNSDIVSQIFDTYEEALITTHQANINERNSIFCKVSEYNNKRKEFDENLEICKKFEQIIQEKTIDIPITKDDIKVKKLTRKKEQ